MEQRNSFINSFGGIIGLISAAITVIVHVFLLGQWESGFDYEIKSLKEKNAALIKNVEKMEQTIGMLRDKLSFIPSNDTEKIQQDIGILQDKFNSISNTDIVKIQQTLKELENELEDLPSNESLRGPKGPPGIQGEPGKIDDVQIAQVIEELKMHFEVHSPLVSKYDSGSDSSEAIFGFQEHTIYLEFAFSSDTAFNKPNVLHLREYFSAMRTNFYNSLVISGLDSAVAKAAAIKYSQDVILEMDNFYEIHDRLGEESSELSKVIHPQANELKKAVNFLWRNFNEAKTRIKNAE